MLGQKKQIIIDLMSSPLELLVNNEKDIRKDNNMDRNSSDSLGDSKGDSKHKKKTDDSKKSDVKEKKEEKEDKSKDSTELSEQAVRTSEDEKKGVAQAITANVQAETQNQQKLDGLLDNAKSILYATKNIIPLLHSEIIIDSGKVTIIHRPFFFSEKIQSVSVQDISDVYIETVPFLAMIKIIDRDFVDNFSPENPNRTATPSPLIVRWLWKGNAERARRIITGLMTASKEGIDLKSISDSELAEKLEEIGKVKETKTSVTNA